MACAALSRQAIDGPRVSKLKVMQRPNGKMPVSHVGGSLMARTDPR